MVYLDHNATTPIDERVLEAMMPFLTKFYGNPSGLYRHGRLVRSAIDTAREQVAALVNAHPMQVIFTSGGTEANNLALMALKPGSTFAISAIEHPSISETAENLAHAGHTLTILPVDSNGLVTEETITETSLKCPFLASIMLANNETGIIQNIPQHADRLRENGVVVHTDAVQALGKISVNFKKLGVNMMSLSSHKIYGPKGCGALVVDKTIDLKPMLLGGKQEHGLRAGTENAAAIIGFGKAAELTVKELAQSSVIMEKLRVFLEERLSAIPKLSIFARNAYRLPNTVQFGIAGLDGEMLLMKLDQKGIAVSSGSACASGGGKPSPVLAAMGINPELAKSAIRVSLGKTNTEAELINFIDLLTGLANPG